MKNFFSLLLVATILTACADASTYLGSMKKTEILPGKREEVLSTLNSLEIDKSLAAKPATLDQAQVNSGWNFSYPMQPQDVSNIALNPDLPNNKSEQIFPGFFNSFGRSPLLPAGPILEKNILYFLDNQNQVSARSLITKKTIWTSTLLKPKFIKDFPAKGGLVLSDNFLYVTNGSEYVTSLNKETGEIQWQKRLGHISRLSPSIKDSRLFVLTADNKLYALNSLTGEVLWTHDGIVGSLSINTMATINSLSNTIIVPHSSGEIYNLEPIGGNIIWQKNLSTKASAINSVSISDVAFTPIIYNDNIYAGTNGGKFTAIALDNGETLFEYLHLYPKNMWVSGDSLVALSQKNELISFDSTSGKVRWRKNFPTKTDYKYARNEAIIMQGPVIAGNYIWVVDNLGKLYKISPHTGEVVNEIKTIKNINQPIFVEDNKLYLLSDDGELAIYW